MQLLEEIEPLLIEHEEELNVTSYPLAVNKMLYIKSNISGMNVAYTVRKDNDLIGYICYWFFDNLHYGTYSAQQDVLFISKPYRKGRTGIKLLKYSEDDLKNTHEVKMILQHTKKHKALDSLFEYLGYSESDKIYIKEL